MKWLFPTWKQFKRWSLPSKLTFYGTALGLVSVSLTLGLAYFSDDIQRAILRSNERISVSGIWRAHHANPEVQIYGGITIPRESAEQIQFELSSVNGAHTCHAAGFAQVSGQDFVYEADECEVTFSYDQNRDEMSVSVTPECRILCGMRAYIPSDYRRVVSALVEFGLLNSIEDVEFRHLVGRHYGLFENNMTSWQTSQSPGYTVHRGHVPGLAPWNAAIILRDHFGNFAAATVDEDFENVIYFSNSSEWLDRVPVEITEWADQLGYRVILAEQ